MWNKMASCSTSSLAAQSTADDDAVAIQRDALLLPERQVGQMWPRHGVVSDLDRGVRLLPRLDAIQEVFDVRFAWDSAFKFVDRFGRDVVTGPRLRVDAVAVVVKDHCGLLALQENLPTVFVRVAVTERPSGEERRVLEGGAERVGNIGAFVYVDRALADG